MWLSRPTTNQTKKEKRKMKRARTSRQFNEATDLEVSKQAGKNIAGFTGNLDLPAPPETPAVLTSLKDGFDGWIIKAANGGKYENEQKDASRDSLLKALNKDASYVDLMCNDDMGILLSSGFDAVSDNRVRAVLQAPIIKGSNYPTSTQIKLLLKGDRARKLVQGRIKPVDGTFGPVITFADAREIIFYDLTPGTKYVMQVCGLGGTNGVSEWSQEVTIVAI